MTISSRLLFAAVLGSSLAAPLAVRAAAPDDPCRVVSKGTVERVLGTQVVHVVPRVQGPSASCSWRSATFMPYALATAFRYGSTGEATKALHDLSTGAASMTGQTTTAVPRIGDGSVALGGMLYVRAGTAVYVFSVVDGKPQPELLPKAERLARLALPSIKR